MKSPTLRGEGTPASVGQRRCSSGTRRGWRKDGGVCGVEGEAMLFVVAKVVRSGVVVKAVVARVVGVMEKVVGPK